MKRFMMAGILLITAVASGCGQYAFFRDPGEQLSINRSYDAQVAAQHGSSAVGATTGTGSGEVSSEYWRH
jgi:hypothetical protein